VIVRDERGGVHAAQSKTLPSYHYQELVIGEAQVVLQAVDFSRDLGL
jgi:hypothetical protein